MLMLVMLVMLVMLMVMLMADADAVSQEVGSDPLELGPSPLFPLHPRRPLPQHLHRGQQLLAGGVKTVLLFSPLFFSPIFFH